MSKYRNITGMGKSKICPYIKGEEDKDRHYRRRVFNLDSYTQVQCYCIGRGITLTIKNDGHHWIACKDTKIIEWWPSTAKAVVNKCWKRGIKCHDYKQFIRILENQF